MQQFLLDVPMIIRVVAAVVAFGHNGTVLKLRKEEILLENALALLVDGFVGILIRQLVATALLRGSSWWERPYPGFASEQVKKRFLKLHLPSDTYVMKQKCINNLGIGERPGNGSERTPIEEVYSLTYISRSNGDGTRLPCLPRANAKCRDSQSAW